LGQHHAEFGEQPADAVDGGSALLDVALAHAVQAEDGLLFSALHRNEAHVGTADRFTDRLRIVAVVLQAHAIRRHETRHHDAHAMAQHLELACPLMRPSASLHPDQARRQSGNQFHQFVAPHRLAQNTLSARIHSVHRKHRLCEIEANGSNLVHDFPSGFRLNIDTSILAPRCRRRHGEVPIIR
jgi:hypothetical protein